MAIEFGRIGVLMGGPSTEREISLKSGKAVYEALGTFNLDLVAIDIKTEDAKENIELIKSQKIDCAFIALHGRFGEDGRIQEILDNLNIPYTGSGKEASELAMDKIASRKIFADHGLKVPRYMIADKKIGTATIFFSTSLFKKIVAVPIIFPLVVKPATHGSSIGLSIVDKKEDLGKALDLAFNFDGKVIIEEYIRGREMTVGVLEDKALPVIEIAPKKRFFDFEAKYQPGMTDYILPAELEEAVARNIQQAALSAHQLLGCFGCSRVDMILSPANIPFILEVNSIPGLTSTSLLPKAAKLTGIEFPQLCLKLIELAYAKV